MEEGPQKETEKDLGNGKVIKGIVKKGGNG